MRIRTGWVAALMGVLLVACSSPSGNEPSSAEPIAEPTASAVLGASESADGAEPDAASSPGPEPPFDVVLEDGATRSEPLGPSGGTVQVSGADSTAYTLDVPAGALLETVEIAATPVLSFGAGNESAHGVVFEPSGLHFLADVTLTMSAPDDIPVERQLVFEFSDDGGELVAAEPVLDDERLVVHVGHFSGFGFADLPDQVREAWTGWRTERAEAQIQNEMRDMLTKERQAQLLGMEADYDPQLYEKFRKAGKRYEKEVVRVRLANADTSCEAAKQAAQTALGYLRQMELLGIPLSNPDSPNSALTVAEVFEAVIGPCHKDAVARCKAAKDPGILIGFWTEADRLSPGRFNVDTTKAELTCDPKAYRFVGGLDDFKVAQVVCNVMEPFTLDSDIGSMTASGGLTGTYEFEGDFDAHYSGTYSIRFPHGPRKPGTMTGHGSGSVAGTAGSGTEKYTVTPVGPAC
jgi:hypothetical protein